MRSAPLLLLLTACGPDLNPIEGTLDSLTLAEDLGEQGVDSYGCGTLMFDWTQAVWAFGIHRLHAVTADDRWQGCYRDWMDGALADFEGEDPESFYSSDSMSPSTLAATLMLEDATSDYSPITEAADSYLASAPRLANGAIAHWGLDNPYGFETDQVWIDSMFMFGAYLVQMYAFTDDDAYLDLWLEQYVAFSELCRDDADQLYRHAWDDSQGANIPESSVFWARGNAWVLVSAAELLLVVGPGNSTWQQVQPLFQRHAEALLAHQDAEDGLWHTVVNEPLGEDPDNYTETSGSALIAYGLARGLASSALEGERWEAAVARAAVGTMGRIDERSDGKLIIEGTSFGTNPGEGYHDYLDVEQVDDMMLGYGPAIMLLAEAHGLPMPDES